MQSPYSDPALTSFSRSAGHGVPPSVSRGHVNSALIRSPHNSHCRGGYGATAFGGVDQRDSSQNGTGQPSIHDREHDMLRALVAWVEEGIAPSHIVASRYKENDRRLGVEFERKLCP